MARMTRDDWLLLGLRALAAAGPDALTIEALTARARLTRGSFYHHFADQGAYIDALASLWQARRLAEMKAALAAAGGAAGGASLSTLVGGLDRALERGMRRLALHSPRVAGAVKAVDDARVHHLAGLQAYPGSAAATDYALIEYAAHLGLDALKPDMNAEDASRLRALVSDMVAAHWNE